MKREIHLPLDVRDQVLELLRSNGIAFGYRRHALELAAEVEAAPLFISYETKEEVAAVVTQRTGPTLHTTVARNTGDGVSPPLAPIGVSCRECQRPIQPGEDWVSVNTFSDVRHHPQCPPGFPQEKDRNPGPPGSRLIHTGTADPGYAEAMDLGDDEPEPVQQLPTRNGEPIPCGNCGKVDHITGACPDLFDALD